MAKIASHAITIEILLVTLTNHYTCRQRAPLPLGTVFITIPQFNFYSMSILPVTVRRAIELMGLYFLGMIIIVGKDVITPIVMAFFLSLMLLPVHRFFMQKKVPETLSIVISLLMMTIVMGLLIWFVSSKISHLISDFPQIKEN